MSKIPSEYPKDDGRMRRFWKWNFACLPCRTHARRSWYQTTPVCPECREQMHSMPHRMAMPKKADKGWAKASIDKYGRIVWPK